MANAPVLAKPLNNNIPQNSQNISSEKISIEEMLKGVNDTLGNAYFQPAPNDKTDINDEENNDDISENDKKEIGIALYTINKEAKRLRDIRENIKEFLFEGGELSEDTQDYLRKKFNGISFDEKGAYIDINGLHVYEDNLQDEIVETEREINGLRDRLDFAEDEEEKEEVQDDIDYYENIYDKLTDFRTDIMDINLHDELNSLAEEKDELYNIKHEIIEKMNPEKIGTQRFADDTARDLYKIGDFTFHGDDISDRLSQEEFDVLEDLDEISSENNLSEEQKISIDKAKEIISKYIKEENTENDFFKKWETAPTIKLNENPEWDNIDDIEDLRDIAEDYLYNTLRKIPLYRKELGLIRFSRKSVREYIAYSADKNKLLSVKQIPQFITEGTLGEYFESTKDRTDDDTIKGFYPIYFNLETPNETKKAEILIAKDENGKLFFDMLLDYNRENAQKMRTLNGNLIPVALNNSISNNGSDFNPSVNKDEGQTYYQSDNNENSSDNTEPSNNSDEIFSELQSGQQELFNEVNSKKLTKVKGAFLTGNNFIQYFKGSDVSTILHETAHWYLDILQKSANHSERAKEKLEAVRKFLKNSGGDFTPDEHEKFARSFEAYIRTGNGRNNRLKKEVGCVV